MELKKEMETAGVTIWRNSSTGTYHLVSPVNGTKRIFHTLEGALNYVKNAEAMDSYARGLARNPW